MYYVEVSTSEWKNSVRSQFSLSIKSNSSISQLHAFEEIPSTNQTASLAVFLARETMPNYYGSTINLTWVQATHRTGDLLFTSQQFVTYPLHLVSFVTPYKGDMLYSAPVTCDTPYVAVVTQIFFLSAWLVPRFFFAIKDAGRLHLSSALDWVECWRNQRIITPAFFRSRACSEGNRLANNIIICISGCPASSDPPAVADSSRICSECLVGSLCPYAPQPPPTATTV